MLEIFNNLRKKIQLAEVEREAPTSWTTPFRMKDCSLSLSRLISNSLYELISSSQWQINPWRRFFSNIPGKFDEIVFFRWREGSSEKTKCRQPENFLEFLQNLFFLSFESILINYRNKGNVTETIFIHFEIPVCIAPPGLSLRVICFF